MFIIKGKESVILVFKDKTSVIVELEDDVTTLNDVVVIGYGTVRKKDLTGAVTSVSAKQIENIPVSNVSEALTGKMAGVNITTTEGSPDADIKIRVRGGGSLSQDNSPLYIVDGFPVTSISDIAPSEIQSIDVLKDASSTAIYGARGANGVVIVTTKSGKEGKTQLMFTRVDQQDWRNSNTVTYDNSKLWKERIHLNVVLGQEWSSVSKTTSTNYSVNFPATMTINEILANPTNGKALKNERVIAADETLLSYFGRINFTLDEKYLATVVLRADGSSLFGEDNRWGLFPSVALAWRLSEEKFMKSTESWLSNLKLRLSFGMAGNNRIPSGSTEALYSAPSSRGTKYPYFGESLGDLLEHGTALYNPDLKWETTVTRNVGIDYGFFKGRISGSLEFYWNTTKDLLMRVQVPTNTGYTYQYQNFGQTSNKGVEFAMNAVLIDKKNFGLNFNFNIAYNKNKIDELPMGDPWQSSDWGGSTIAKYEDFRVEEGGSLGEVWGYKTNGFFTVYDPVSNPDGQLVLDGTTWKLRDGIVDNSASITGGTLMPGGLRVEVDENGEPLKQRLGNTVPTTTGGFGFDGRVGNFDFNVFFNYSLGNQIINATKLANAGFYNTRRYQNIVDDFSLGKRYTGIDPATGVNISKPTTSIIAQYGGADNLIARLNEINAGASIYNPSTASRMQLTDYAVEDASFLRLQNVTIGYTLPKKWVRSVFLTNVRIYFTGYNLLCFTDYSGYDPEVDTSSKKNPMCPGVDYAAYPKARTYVGGINITF